jgi:hypothetical protein
VLAVVAIEEAGQAVVPTLDHVLGKFARSSQGRWVMPP